MHQSVLYQTYIKQSDYRHYKYYYLHALLNYLQTFNSEALKAYIDGRNSHQRLRPCRRIARGGTGCTDDNQARATPAGKRMARNARGHTYCRTIEGYFACLLNYRTTTGAINRAHPPPLLQAHI